MDTEEIEKAKEEAYSMLMSLDYNKATPKDAKQLFSTGLNIDTHDEIDETPLIKALLVGNFAFAKYCLDNGANMYAYDTGGRTSMMICAQKGYLDFGKELIKKGYDINKKVPSNNHSVLSLAVWANQVEMVRFLLRNGANPNLCDNLGWTAYDVAEFCKNDRIIQLLGENK